VSVVDDRQSDGGDSAARYAEAALNKVELAERDLLDLRAVREGVEVERAAIQRALEGILSRGTSAGDQLAGALAAEMGVSLKRNTPQSLLKLIDDQPEAASQCTDLVQAFRAWANEPIVRDARSRRNLAIHDHYEKSPNRLIKTWLLEEILVDRKPSPYHGPLDVHTYCEGFINTLQLLRPIADGLASGRIRGH
jgi:hypothetical protein